MMSMVGKLHTQRYDSSVNRKDVFGKMKSTTEGGKSQAAAAEEQDTTVISDDDDNAEVCEVPLQNVVNESPRMQPGGKKSVRYQTLLKQLNERSQKHNHHPHQESGRSDLVKQNEIEECDNLEQNAKPPPLQEKPSLLLEKKEESSVSAEEPPHLHEKPPVSQEDLRLSSEPPAPASRATRTTRTTRVRNLLVGNDDSMNPLKKKYFEESYNGELDNESTMGSEDGDAAVTIVEIEAAAIPRASLVDSRMRRGRSSRKAAQQQSHVLAPSLARRRSRSLSRLRSEGTSTTTEKPLRRSNSGRSLMPGERAPSPTKKMALRAPSPTKKTMQRAPSPTKISVRAPSPTKNSARAISPTKRIASVVRPVLGRSNSTRMKNMAEELKAHRTEIGRASSCRSLLSTGESQANVPTKSSNSKATSHKTDKRLLISKDSPLSRPKRSLLSRVSSYREQGTPLSQVLGKDGSIRNLADAATSLYENILEDTNDSSHLERCRAASHFEYLSPLTSKNLVARKTPEMLAKNRAQIEPLSATAFMVKSIDQYHDILDETNDSARLSPEARTAELVC